jgi:hypothetical protein
VTLDPLDQEPEVFFALPQQLFVGAAFGQVARDLGKPDQLAHCIAQRRDDDVGPEAAAILADAPVLVLETSQLARAPQLLVRPVFRESIGRVEPREMLADDFIGRIALDALRALVSRRDDAIRIQHEDRVIADAFDHEPGRKTGSRASGMPSIASAPT